jgi:hypothetical protein
MNNRQSSSPLEISSLAEGTQKTGESTEPTSHLQPTTISTVHSGFDVNSPLAEEGKVSQADVELEGRDDTDAQDAALTTNEGKLHRFARTAQYGSSNRTPARCGTLDLGDTGTYEHPLPRGGESMNQASGLTGDRLIEINEYRDILAGTLQDK